MTGFSAESYRDAAREHAPVAEELYDAGHYVLAIYVAGLAVEAIFRAYRYRFDPEFDARHDLLELSRKSRFIEVVPEQQLSDIMAAIGTVATCWSNNHRYRSEKSLRKLFKSAHFDRAVRKGDFLKELTRRIVNAAFAVVMMGVNKWPK